MIEVEQKGWKDRLAIVTLPAFESYQVYFALLARFSDAAGITLLSPRPERAR
jgi:hypothetical protein